MCSRLFNIAAALSLLFAATGMVGAEESGAAQIRAALTDWKNQFNDRNSQAVCNLFAPYLIAMFQGQPVRDFDQVCTLLRSSLGDSRRHYHYDLDIKDVYASGNLGAVRLIWTLKVTGDDGTPVDTSVEPGIDIFQRQPDGKWRISRYISFAQNNASH